MTLFHTQASLNDAKFKALGVGDAWLNSHPGLRIFGATGVDIFFVISGVVITYASWNLFGQSNVIRTFLKKRVIRIFPLYWLCLAPWMIWYYAQAALYHNNHTAADTPLFFLSSFFLLPYPSRESLLGAYVLFPSWQLTFELYFYGLTACFLAVARKYFLPGTALAFLAGIWFLRPYRALHPLLAVLSDPLLLEFVFGILIGIAVRRKVRPPLFCIVSALLAAPALFWLELSGFWALPGGRFMAQGLPAALLVFGLIFWEQVRGVSFPAWLVRLGDSSYSLYLSHALTILILRKIWKVSGCLATFPPDLAILLIWLGCALAGLALWRFVEQPLTAWLSRLWLKPGTSRVAFSQIIDTTTRAAG